MLTLENQVRGRKVKMHDMSLRDGMHSMRHQITIEQMIDIATGLDEAGVPLIQVRMAMALVDRRSITGAACTLIRNISLPLHPT